MSTVWMSFNTILRMAICSDNSGQCLLVFGFLVSFMSKAVNDQQQLFWVSNINTKWIHEHPSKPVSDSLLHHFTVTSLYFLNREMCLDSKTVRSSRVPTFKNCWQACCVCLRRHCGPSLRRPGQSVWEPGSKEKRSSPWPDPEYFLICSFTKGPPFPLVALTSCFRSNAS